MIYTSIRSAVVSALAAETIDNTAKQAWQKLYQPGYAESEGLAGLIRGSNTSGIKRIDADCWVHARLHSQLKPRHWNALVAKYSTHKAKKVEAISALVPVIASHAPQLFVMKAVTAWAIPQLKGVEGKRSSDMIVLPQQFYDINSWDSRGLVPAVTVTFALDNERVRLCGEGVESKYQHRLVAGLRGKGQI
ncbi:TPA: hypothetical protein L4556_004136 [Pseudomonas aeruginosa]|nr:hypothetical protein [Pseudomonas aeruginosa]